MDLQAIVETITQTKQSWESARDKAERADRMESATYYQGMVDAARYALAVIEEAERTPTFERYLVWFRPSVTGNPEWDMCNVHRDECTNLEMACRVVAMLQDENPGYVITLVES
jgi:hypothetical protein